MLRLFRCIIDNEFSFPGPGLLRSISPASKSKRHNTILKAKSNFTLFIYIPFHDICE